MNGKNIPIRVKKSSRKGGVCGVTYSTASEPHIFEYEQRETQTANVQRHRDMLDNFLHPEMDAHECEPHRSAKNVAKYLKASTSKDTSRNVFPGRFVSRFG